MKNQFLMGALFLALTSLFCTSSKAQGSSPPDTARAAEIFSHMVAMDTSYWAIKEMADTYIEAFPDSGSFSKRYWRWNYFWKNRIDSTGDFTKPLENMAAFRAANGGTTLCSGAGNWTQLGPVVPNFKQSGIIVSVYSPPHHPDIIYAGSNTGGLWKTTNGGFHWECKTDVLGMPGMGVNSIIGHPDIDSFNVIFIATGFATEFYTSYGLGVFKSLDGGDSWRDTELIAGGPHSGTIYHKLLRNPQNSNVIYAISDKKVHQSINNGENWTIIAQGNHKPGQPAPTPNVVLASSEGFRQIEILPSDPDIIIVSSAMVWKKRAQLWTFHNTSQTWTNITPTKMDAQGNIISIFCENYNLAVTDKDLHAVYMTSLEFDHPNPDDKDPNFPGGRVPTDNHTILRKIDFSVTPPSTTIVNGDMVATSNGFGNRSVLRQEFLRPVFRISPVNKNVMLVGGNVMFRSTDGGQSFFRVTQYDASSSFFSTHADIRAIQFYGTTGDTIIMGDDGGVGRSENGGAGGTWRNLNNRNQTPTPSPTNSPLIVSQVFYLANSSSRPGVIFGGLQDNGTMELENGSWEHVVDGDGGECIIDYVNDEIIYARSNEFLLQRVSNTGTFGDIHKTGSGTSVFDGFILDQSKQDHFDIFIARNKNLKKLRTNPNRASANTINNTNLSLADGEAITTFSVAPSNSDIIYVGINKGTEKIHKSVDGGDNFSKLGFSKGDAVTSIAIDPEDADRLWVSIVLSHHDAVQHSNDGGITFSPFGAGFPHVPVTSLEYQKGSNDVIYAGTDVGVYRYDPTTETNYDPNTGRGTIGTGTWECFNGTAPNNIPPTIVTDIEIDYCQGLIHVSTFGRGIWESPLPPIDEWVISQNTTIEAGMVTSINNDIVVPPGKRLTILGKLNMGEGTHIKVKYGGELIIDGGIITNECGLTWEGIDVEGTAYQPQSGPGSLTFPNSLHGKVILKNGAIIEHAKNAITTRGNSAIIWTAGGIIQAEDGVFRNNRRDIEFLEYKTQSNISYFENCNFLVNNDYRFSIVKPRVTLWGVRGVDFIACNFEILNSNFMYQGDGIFSIDAGYTVEAECSGNYTPTGCLPGTPSTFKNLKNGIHATRSRGSQFQIIVDASTFENNRYGIISNNMFDPQITRNNFIIGGANVGTPTANAGLLITTGSSYRVEENTFTGISLSQPISIGTYIVDTKDRENQIYKNTFSNLFAANLAARDNRSTTGANTDSKGLQYLCNTQSNDIYDIAVSNGAGIRFHQGTPSPNGLTFGKASQNTYSRNGTLESDFYNHANNPIHEFYDNTNIATIAQDVTNSFYSQEAGVTRTCTTKVNISPGGGLSGGEKGTLIQQFNSNKTEHQNLYFIYLSLLDGGDTEVLLDSINYQWAIDAWELRDNLLAESPNLSLDALWEAANTGILPDAMLMEVLVANIAACQNDEFFYALANEIPNLLPQYMVDMLIGAPEPPSLRQTLEEKMAYHSSAYSDAAILITHDILRDSVPDLDSLRLWYGNLGGLHAAYLVAESYLDEGDVITAQSYMSTLTNLFAYAEKYPDHHTAYEDLFNLKILLDETNRSWDSLTTSEIQELETLANEDKGDASVHAQNILRFFYDQTYDIPLILPDSTTPQRMANPAFQLDLVSDIEIRAFPNPAKDYVTFEYRYSDQESSVSISIMDLSGRTIKELPLNNVKGQVLWDTRELPAGQYLYVLKSQAKVLASGRISILK